MDQQGLDQYKRQAADLSQVAQQAEATKAAQASAAQKEAEQIALSWDRNMRRAFKGILSRPVGRAMLMRAAERQA